MAPRWPSPPILNRAPTGLHARLPSLMSDRRVRWVLGKLRVGDVVEIKSLAEIAATLDGQGTLHALPFMPEMAKFAGRRLTVDRTADKVCDTAQRTGSRRIEDTVLLGDLRCDGAAHDGCQAECRLFFNEAWLRRVSPDEPTRMTPSSNTPAALSELLERNTRTAGADGAARYKCQATELLAASQRVRVTDPLGYLRVLFAGNVGLVHFVRVMVRAFRHDVGRKIGRASDHPFPVRAAKAAPSAPVALAVSVASAAPATTPKAPPLGLKPGDRVRVKRREEIARTLNERGFNRGLWFDREMLPFCGESFEVRRRVTHFINEANGEMIRLKSDCLTLEGVVCSGEYSSSRWFCPRAIHPYWRESWLERESDPSGQAVEGTGD